MVVDRSDEASHLKSQFFEGWRGKALKVSPVVSPNCLEGWGWIES